MLNKRIRAGKMPAILPLICAVVATTAYGGDEAQSQANQGRGQDPLFLTATNGANNFLAVVNTRTKGDGFRSDRRARRSQRQCRRRRRAAEISRPRSTSGPPTSPSSSAAATRWQPTQMIKTSSQPVSVAFGHNHLVVLGLTTAESFPVYGNTVGTDNDGVVQLARRDKSAAQIVTYDGGVVYSEKSGSMAELNLSTNGMAGLSGPNRPVLLPTAPNNDTPFGMVARGANVYVTIAHSNLEVLVVNGQIMSLPPPARRPSKTGPATSPTRPAGTLSPDTFCFSADSPGKQLLRYLVSDSNVFFDKAGSRQTDGRADGPGRAGQPSGRHRWRRRRHLQCVAVRHRFRGRTHPALRGQDRRPHQRRGDHQ